MSWSRNPILFSFKVNPFNVNDINNRTKVQFALMVETFFNSGIYVAAWRATEYPDANGFATIDLSPILDTQLEFYVPNKQYVKFHRCKKQVKKYYLSYSIQDNDGTLTVPADTSIFYVCKGGLSKEQWHRSEFFANNILLQHNALINIPDFEFQDLRTDEPKWLYFMLPANASTYLKLLVSLVFNGALGPTYDMLEQNLTGYKWEIFCVPVDYDTLDIEANTTPGDITTFYTVGVFDDTNQLVSNVGYKLDYRPMYEALYLLYRNSLGGLDTQSFLGEKDFDIEVQKSKAEIVQLTDYLNAFNMQYESFTLKSFRAQKTKANTGWISKNTTDRLIDMFLDKQVYSPLGNKLIPVQIDSKSATLYKDVTKLYNLTLEWALAWMDENFTLQNTVTQGDTCPAVFYFEASQVYGGKLHIVWKLEADWDKIEIVYIFDATTYTITLAGNSGETDIFIQDPGTGADKSVQVKARTVCNDEVAPLSYGPYTSISIINILVRMVPMAIDDTADETYRGIGTRILQRLGANMLIAGNDLVLNGGTYVFESFFDDLFAVTAVSHNGANIVYNVDGTISYSPTGGSLAITSEDYVLYRFKENIPVFGFLSSNYARIRIPMKGQVPKIYVRRAYHETDNGFIKYGFSNSYSMGYYKQDIWLQFFKDEACTIPIDVTSFGLQIKYNETTQINHYNYFGGGTTGVVVNLGDTLVALTGLSTLIKPNYDILIANDLGGISGADQTVNTLTFLYTGGVGNFQLLSMGTNIYF
ncbi:MAG: hypothetical protein IPG85_11920 [Bacteroidetes bacterium]|nr:hypothetical protein [Bacteroidota bacterium]